MLKKKFTILIPNATGPSNIGDQSMLFVLLKLLRQVYKNAEIVVHTSDPQMYAKQTPYLVSPSIYQYVGLRHKGEGKQIFTVIQYLMQFALAVNDLQIKSNSILTRLINDYKRADLIIFVGGGYLRARKGWSQNLNLFLQLSMLYLASTCHVKIIVAPISFGPFAHPWQAKLSAWFLRKADHVFAREDISYKIMRKYNIAHVIKSSDHALLLGKTKQRSGNVSVIGFTIRNWSKSTSGQKNLEDSYVYALQNFHLKTGWSVQPIIQATAESPNEDDRITVGRVYKQLKQLKVNVKKPIVVSDLAHAIDTYSKLGLFLGMRMHSNIIAATQGVPFVAVSYEHKTEGIAKQIDMQEYCISYEQVNKDKLFGLLSEVYKKRKYLKQKLINSVAAIQDIETRRWSNFLAS